MPTIQIEVPAGLEKEAKFYLEKQLRKFISTRKIRPEVEKSWYKNPENPKRFDYDIVEKEFTNADEAVNFLRGYYAEDV